MDSMNAVFPIKRFYVYRRYVNYRFGHPNEMVNRPFYYVHDIRAMKLAKLLRDSDVPNEVYQVLVPKQFNQDCGPCT